MPPAPTTQQMGEKHEKYLAELNGGRKTRSSGNQWNDQADGYNHPDDPFSWRWDGKSTKGKQIAITLAMVEKIIEQAGDHRPMIALRWYGNDALTQILADWIAVQASDWSEVLASAREAESLRARLQELETAPAVDGSGLTGENERLRARNQELEEGVAAALRDIDGVQSELAITRGQMQAQVEEIERLRQNTAQAAEPGGGGGGGGQPASSVPDYVPALPWVIISQMGGVITVVRYGPEGARTEGLAQTAVVERSMNSGNRPRIVLDNLRVPNASLYVNGNLVARACESRQDLEFG
jgi:hypothetical protein